jgi:D-lactate dehydrogenase (cytochrome)
LPDVTTALVDALLGVVGDPARVSTGDSERDLHAEDLTYHAPHRPDVVVYALETPEVAGILRVAAELAVPVTPVGAGTSLEGHVIPVRGGISLDLSRMDRLLALRPDELTATAQAGVTRDQLTRAAAEHGLQFPVDPGADATLGGMAATNASGTTTIRYGKMRAQVLALEAVLPGGRVIRTGSRAPKTSAGYDLTGLLVGSEGTLAVITELTVRLHPIPEATALVRASFAAIEGAGRAVTAIVGAGTALSRLEIMDAWTARAVNRYAGSDLVEGPTLFAELSGAPATVAADLQDLRWILAEHDALDVVQEDAPAGQRRLWRARHDAFFAQKAVAPGKEHRTTDICVPVSELAGALETARAWIDRLGLEAGIVGHAGDGNLHVAILTDVHDAGEMRRAAQLTEAVVDDALARGGTCTGEHGIGLGKIGALAKEHGDLLGLMGGVKAVFDPQGLMNPGKVLAG